MNQTAIYQRNTVTTMHPGQIVVLLYDAAVKSLKQALIDIEANRLAEKTQRIKRAIDIIGELRNSLDMRVGGEVAENLDRLYEFMIRHLNCVNRNEQMQHIREVVAILADLGEAWRTVND